VADESLFLAWTPTATNENDGAPGIATALKFSADKPGVIKGIRFYRTTTDGGTYSVRLWQVTAGEEDPGPGAGTLVPDAEKTFVGVATTGWNTVLFDTPIPILANTLYVAERHNTQGRYVAETAGLITSIVVGSLKAWGANESGEWPAFGTIRNGTYRAAAAGNYPNQFAGTPNYGVDVVYEATADAAEGTADLGLALAVAGTGGRESAGSNVVGLALAVAATGDAPDIPPSEGTSDIPLALTLGAMGVTPAEDPAEGQAALGLALAVAATGQAPTPGQSDGVAALSLALTVAATGEAPEVTGGVAALGLELALAAVGVTPPPGEADGVAALGIVFTVMTTGSNGEFRCRPVRSFSEVMA
jgi:hypothetical protein